MSPETQVRDADLSANATEVVAPGTSVVVLRPRALRGTVGIVRRRLPSGWEVEIRTTLGLPMHLTVAERGLRLR